jgi:hypothetical protein
MKRKLLSRLGVLQPCLELGEVSDLRVYCVEVEVWKYLYFSEESPNEYSDGQQKHIYSDVI